MQPVQCVFHVERLYESATVTYHPVTASVKSRLGILFFAFEVDAVRPSHRFVNVMSTDFSEDHSLNLGLLLDRSLYELDKA